MSSTAKTDAAAAAATPEQLAAVDSILAKLGDRPGALLPVFHAVQDELGYVPPEATGRIADALGLSRAEVHGVLTYYHDFRTAPPGRHILKVCRAEACRAMGAAALEERLKTAHDLPMHSTAPDGSLTLEPVYCLGNCALAPAVQLDGEVLGRVTGKNLDAIVKGCGGEA